MKDITVNIAYLLMASFAVIGLVEWIKSLVQATKNFIKDKKQWSALVWVIASFVLSFIVAWAGDGGVWQVLSNGLFILAINELVGYNIVIKTVFSLIDRVTGSSNPDLLSDAQKKIDELMDMKSTPQ
jgi:hypothetical protein